MRGLEGQNTPQLLNLRLSENSIPQVKLYQSGLTIRIPPSITMQPSRATPGYVPLPSFPFLPSPQHLVSAFQDKVSPISSFATLNTLRMCCRTEQITDNRLEAFVTCVLLSSTMIMHFSSI